MAVALTVLAGACAAGRTVAPRCAEELAVNRARPVSRTEHASASANGPARACWRQTGTTRLAGSLRPKPLPEVDAWFEAGARIATDGASSDAAWSDHGSDAAFDPFASALPQSGMPPTGDAERAPAHLGSAAGLLFASRPSLRFPGEEPKRSFLIPALEIVAFEFLLNQYDRHFDSEAIYGTSYSTFEDNLQSGWVIDRDPFSVNQIGHPYSGSVYQTFARSAGFGFWGSMAYALGGSALWETAGETVRPSINDMITTTIGGSFLGEAFYRTATWMRGTGEDTVPTLAAVAIAPAAMVNRWLFGDRFEDPYPRRDFPVFGRTGLGVRTNTHLSGRGRSNTNESTDALVDFRMDHGLPGPGTPRHEHPFDLFHFEAAVQSDLDDFAERLLVRGLLAGRDYERGADLHGVFGLYGSYDYLSPGIFRLSSTALSFGTSLQLRLAERIAMQATCLDGLGFGAAGTIADEEVDRDYHYGAVPRGSLDLRFTFGDTVLLGLVGHHYHIVNSLSDAEREHTLQAEVFATLRLSGPHAVTVQYTSAWRDAHYDDEPNQQQSVGSVMFVYSYLGSTRFGVR